jgi:hypothetical protein
MSSRFKLLRGSINYLNHVIGLEAFIHPGEFRVGLMDPFMKLTDTSTVNPSALRNGMHDTMRCRLTL